jgi:hypothetical protein
MGRFAEERRAYLTDLNEQGPKYANAPERQQPLSDVINSPGRRFHSPSRDHLERVISTITPRIAAGRSSRKT